MSVDLLCKLTEIDHNELEDYNSNPLIICQKSFLPKITGPIYSKLSVEDDKNDKKKPTFDINEWFPFCNSYYNFSEQVDAFARTNHLLGLRSSSTTTTSFKNETENTKRKFLYSTRQSQIDYLESKPLSFLILGKPSIGEEDLGKQLADYWQCVYLDPETLIKEEMESGSRAGQCIEFNLRCGRAIGIDVILRLIKKRVKTESVLHRGFVLCGLPVIPNDLYEEDPVSAESAVFTVQEIFEEILDNAYEATVVPVPNLMPSTPRLRSIEDTSSYRASRVEFGEFQYTDIPASDSKSIKSLEGKESGKIPSVRDLVDNVVPPDLGDLQTEVCDPPEISTNYKEQLNFIMDLFEGPFMIIYMICESEDVIRKRRDYRYDIYSQTVIDLLKEKTDKNLLSLFSHQTRLGLGVLNPIDEIFENVSRFLKDSSELVHLVKLPRDFPAHVQTQLQRFHDVAASLIEAVILEHDPEYYLKVDGRTCTNRIFNSVKWKLRTSNVQRVLLPEKIISTDTMGTEGEDSEFPKKLNMENMEKCFKDFSRRKIVNTMFKWEYSDWGPRCPVAMTEGKYVDGDPAYAVQFMNHIFFLSSQEAFIKFYRNPRPFLLPPNPRSHGKLYVIGPGCSGKTAVSNCLGYYLNSTVLSPTELYKNFVNQKRENLLERMRQAMITDKLTMINTDLIRNHQLEKLILEEKVNIWLSKFRHYIDNEVLKAKRSKSDVHLQLSSFPVLMGFKVNREDIEKEVPFEGIFLNESTARDLVDHPDRMLMYLPEELRRTVKDYVPVTVLEESILEEIEDYVQKSDMDEIILGEEDFLEMYGTAIRQEEAKYMERENCRGGWIIDGFSYDFNFFQRVYDECPPDHVIILEDSSNGDFLLDRFRTRGANLFHDYRGFFRSIDRPDLAERVVDEDHETTRDRIIEDILGDVFTQKEFLIKPEDPEDVTEEVLLERRESQINYKNELEEFDVSKEQILGFLVKMKKDAIVLDVKDKTLVDLMREVLSSFEDRYRLPAEVFSDHDRLQEATDFGYNADAEGAGEGVDLKGQEEFEANRRYGDTFKYCPVTFHEKGVLWEGKKDHAAKFQGKLYLCSSKEDLDAFIKKPRKYLPIDKPFGSFPPPRICVIGHSKSGRTSTSKTISKNFACCYMDFMEFLRAKGAEKENSENYQNIQEYLHTDTPLQEELLKEFLYPLWFEEPYRTMGFVIDDFPKRPSDITAITNHKTIPDVVISMKVPKKELYERTLGKELDDWQNRMQEVRSKRHIEHLELHTKWEQSRKERFEQLMEAKKQQRYAERKQRVVNEGENVQKATPERPYMEDLQETDEELSSFRSKSQVTYDSVAEQADVEEVNKQLSAELPEPLFDIDIENIADVSEKIKVEFEDRYSREIDFLKLIKEMLLTAPIPYQELNSEKKLEMTQYAALLAVDGYKFRNRSFFERTYEVSIEVAERLLASGYYFLSMFGRTCPIQYHKQDVKVQLFIPMEQQFNVFPMIHRQYIYFLVGKEGKEQFRKDPLRYVDIDNFNFPLLPIRIALIGPPKCGKTALADRFRIELGLKVVSKGQAARYVMNYLPYSALGLSMESRLRMGLELKEKTVLSCFEAVTYDPRAVTQGFVMDGFPNSAKEVKYLTSMGLMPQLVIDLYTEDPGVYDYVSTEASKIFSPPYSKHFMEYRYKIWENDQEGYRTWLDGEYQNMVRVPINTCMWDIWEKAYDFLKAAVYEIRHYFIHCKDGWPLRLANMLVSPLEFMERESIYKTYCPCCLYHSNSLVSGGFPPDRTGLVHFRKYFYYVCADHIEEFLETPCQFLPPYNPNKLPVDLPQKVKLDDEPDNVYQNGFCVVCGRDEMKSVKGTLEYATKFGNYVYMCDTEECDKKFRQSPMTYFNVTITLKDVKYPALNYKDLPPLGCLEQFVAKDVINAIKATAAMRPVLPGLTIQQSALLTMAMHLKIDNGRLSAEERGVQKEALDLMKKRRKDLLKYLEMFRKYRNPFIYYEEPVPALKITEWIKERFGDTVPAWSYTEIHPDQAFNLMEGPGEDSSRVPVPDARYDYLCEYFKPLSKVPAFLNVVDIAGLVKGASEGQGLGNAFLSHISACDAIFHLCRAFEDDDVTHVEGEVNPVRDLEIINEELRLKDEETLNKALDKLGRVVERGGDKKLKPEYDTLQKVKHVLVEEKNHIRFADWDSKDIEILNKYLFLTSKPALYLINLSEKDYIKKKNKWLIKIKEWVDKHDPGALIIPFSGAFEHKLVEEFEDPVLRKKFLEDNNVTSALDKIVVNGYKALQLEYFFTAGHDEVKAWTIQKGTKAPQAAGRIHTDFEKGFIMAEVMKFQDFKEEGSESACKAAGKYRQQGRNYVVEDGDIIFFKFNAGAGLKDAKKK
ncbi:adenylate kinase 9 [Coccinella septempunctata]|uniref:adenylate kinase 9 n=1 Tax=Coccinella septempunctata TaxID=41139 RepID=UPI001D088240|nr:adenylate kinase 9 [Coccinella septempunctata]